MDVQGKIIVILVSQDEGDIYVSFAIFLQFKFYFVSIYMETNKENFVCV